MLATNGAPERARWELIWVGKDKKIKRKAFESDLAGALALYIKAHGKLRAVTLRCCNMGFPPPEDLQPRKVMVKEGKLRVEKLYVPMKKKNREGVFWCPYCMKLRKFVRKESLKSPSGMVLDESRFCCPLCGVGHRDHNIRKYNPLVPQIAYQIEAEGTRAPRRTVETRRQTRRRKKRAEA